MMILQGVGHPVPYLGVSYANDPQKGGYMAYAPALDLTTLFEVNSAPPINLQTTEFQGFGGGGGHGPGYMGLAATTCVAKGA